jgi:hypothetical protein
VVERTLSKILTVPAGFRTKIAVETASIAGQREYEPMLYALRRLPGRSLLDTSLALAYNFTGRPRTPLFACVYTICIHRKGKPNEYP